jgi:hypothetical protein
MKDNQRSWPFGHRRDPEEQPDGAEPASRDQDLPDQEETQQLDSDDAVVPQAADTPPIETGDAPEAEEGWGWVDEEQEAGRPAKPTVWSRFRRWRRSRPFWGAFFVLLGGLVVAVPPLAAYKIILVAPSVAIATGVGWVIVILGLVSFMTPSQNKLYGLLAILAGGLAVVTSNLGGFLLGTILTVLGGALTFAWTPLPPEEQPGVLQGRGPEPEEETTEPEDYRTEQEASAGPGEDLQAPPEELGTSYDDRGRPRDDGLAQRSWIESR